MNVAGNTTPSHCVSVGSDLSGSPMRHDVDGAKLRSAVSLGMIKSGAPVT